MKINIDSNEYSKQRNLRIQGEADPGLLGYLADALKGIDGVFEATLQKGTILRVSYDLRRLQLDDLEGIIRKYGFSLSNTLWSRLYRTVIHMTEKNEYEHFHREPLLCCSDVYHIFNARHVEKQKGCSWCTL